MNDFEPAYRKLPPGDLKNRTEQARKRLADCDICAWNCRVNRVNDAERGNCRTGENAIISGGHPHFGEEPPLVGQFGSGTIFFSWCNLRCQFCQNSDISQQGEGIEVNAEHLAALMIRLQTMGCHNINLVSPSHVVPQWLGALELAAEAGLQLPIVYNTGGYDSLDTLRLLDGIIDIYMPDMKFMDEASAGEFSQVPDYPAVNMAAVREMHRQVGDLICDHRAVAQRGLLVRHLVLPENRAGTDRVVRFLADELSPHTYLNIMDQYRPCYKAGEHPPLDRRITRIEFAQAVQLARDAGLTRLDGV